MWISITGYGRSDAAGERVGFGDDAAVAGGLVVWDAEGPCFCADAVADPTTGLVAAAAALRGLAAGGRWLVDVALRDVAAELAGPTLQTGDRQAAPPRPPHQRAGRGGRSRGRHPASARAGRAVPMTGGLALHLHDVEVDGERLDVVIVGGRVTAIGPGLRPPAGARLLDGAAGALLPGLHDHHLHLAAMAARAGSVPLGPPTVRTLEAVGMALAAADAAATPGQWLRCVDYHESVAGDLDRDDLDRFVPGRPIRVQHRSGSMWLLNGQALDAIGADAARHPGIERDEHDRPTGRIFRADDWLRGRWSSGMQDFATVGRRLAACGVTGVTDATPTQDAADWELLAEAARTDLPCTVQVTGGPGLAAHGPPSRLCLGPVKLVVEDHRLPPLDQLVDGVRTAHAAGRPVAVHCVTRVALALALATLDEAGVRPGDRIEHAAVADAGLTTKLARQPASPWSRSPGSSLNGATSTWPRSTSPTGRTSTRAVRCSRPGSPWAGAPTAPFTAPDPWRAMCAAVERRTAAGVVLSGRETITPARALALFLAPLDDPGGQPRQVRPGAPADLCLLDRPLAEQLAQPDAAAVRLTLHAGRVTHEAYPRGRQLWRERDARRGKRQRRGAARLGRSEAAAMPSHQPATSGDSSISTWGSNGPSPPGL